MDDFEKELEEITQAAGETVVTHFSRSPRGEIRIDPAAPGASEMDLKGAKVGAKCVAEEVKMNSMVLGYIL